MEPPMMILDARLVMRSALVGTVAQLALAAAAHFFPWIAGNLALFARMMLSASAGYLYGLVLGQGYGRGALGGAIAGGLCVVPALVVSVLLGDSGAAAMTTITLIAIGTGAVGGFFGQMGAILRKLGL